MEDPAPSPSQANEVEARKGKRTIRIVVLFFLLINGAILLLVLQKPEPTYQGKTVIEWLKAAGPFEPRPEVVNALGPDAWPQLVRALREKDTKLKKAYRALWQRLPTYLAGRLHAYQPVGVEILHLRARHWLMELGPDAKAAVPDLIKLSRHETDLIIRCGAIQALGLVGLESAEALQTLIDLLHEPDRKLGRNLTLHDVITHALARFGPAARPAVPVLVESIRSRKHGKRFGEIIVLGCIGPEAKEAVPVLVDALRESEPMERLLAIEALFRIGPDAKPALAALKEIESTETDALRLLATLAIDRIEENPWRSVVNLIAALNAPGTLSVPPANDAWPWDVPHLNVARKVSYLPWLVPSPTFRAQPQSQIGLQTSDAAIWFLGELGPYAMPALPALERKLATVGPRTRGLVAWSLWKIAKSPEQVSPLLFEPRDIPDDTMLLALETLEEMGPDAKAAVPALVQLIEQRKTGWGLRRESLRALRRIDPDAAAKASPR